MRQNVVRLNQFVLKKGDPIGHGKCTNGTGNMVRGAPNVSLAPVASFAGV